jgi:hypothetical protein
MPLKIDPFARWIFFDPKNLQCALPGSDFQVAQGFELGMVHGDNDEGASSTAD